MTDPGEFGSNVLDYLSELRRLRERDAQQARYVDDLDAMTDELCKRVLGLKAELAAARAFQLALAERVAICSELLSRRAEKG